MRAPRLIKATLNMSLAACASLLRAVCGVANPRHGYGYGCGLRLASHPEPRRAHPQGLIQRRLNSGAFSGLFSLTGGRRLTYISAYRAGSAFWRREGGKLPGRPSSLPCLSVADFLFS
jgi:hypothetical protein